MRAGIKTSNILPVLPTSSISKIDYMYTKRFCETLYTICPKGYWRSKSKVIENQKSFVNIYEYICIYYFWLLLITLRHTYRLIPLKHCLDTWQGITWHIKDSLISQTSDKYFGISRQHFYPLQPTPQYATCHVNGNLTFHFATSAGTCTPMNIIKEYIYALILGT